MSNLHPFARLGRATIAGRPLRSRDWLFLAVLVAANVVPWGVLAWGVLQ